MPWITFPSVPVSTSTVPRQASNSQLTSLVIVDPSQMKTSCTNCAPAGESAATEQQMRWKTVTLQRKGQSRGVGSFLRGSTALQSVSFSLAPHLQSTPAKTLGEILNLTNPGPCSSHFILNSLCQYRLPCPSSGTSLIDTIRANGALTGHTVSGSWQRQPVPHCSKPWLRRLMKTTRIQVVKTQPIHEIQQVKNIDQYQFDQG